MNESIVSAVGSRSNPGLSKNEFPPLRLPPLIPIRINVVSKDQTVRIVDTLLWDLSLGSDAQTAHDLAYHVLSDLEVQGMSRTARHFTGRVELWNSTAQQLIQNQIQNQLDAAVHAFAIEQRRVVGKRRQLPMIQNQENKMDPSLLGTNKVHQTEVNPESSAEEITTTPLVAASSGSPEKSSHDHHHRHKRKKSPNIIPIRLRLIVNNVRIHDDFEWDCNLQHVYSPLDMACDLGRDLKLNDEAVQAIAIEITEQILRASHSHEHRHGLPSFSSSYLGWNEDSEQLYRTLQRRHKESKTAVLLVPPSSAKDISPSNTTAAWEMDARDHVTNTTYVISQLKPN